MKKRKLFIATLLVVAATSIALVSCKKEKQDQMLNNKEQVFPSANNKDEYLIAFKKKLLSAEKGVETLTLEQAERDLGNLLNFDFGDANYATDEFRYDTINLKLNLSNGQVDLAQLAFTYNTAVSSILDIYQTIDLPEKSVYAISCSFNEAESKNSEVENVEIVLISRGYSGNMSVPYYQQHDTIDWRPKKRGGSCDGQIQFKGGPEIMSKWILESQEPMGCVNGGRLYYTDEGTWEVYGSQHYDSISGMYKIFTVYNQNIDSVCITHEEMEYYFANILGMWNYPEISHVIIKVKIEPVRYYFYDGYLWTWRVRIDHGKPNCTDIDPLL